MGLARLKHGMGLTDKGEVKAPEDLLRDNPLMNRALGLITRIRKEVERPAETRDPSLIYRLLRLHDDSKA